MNKLLDATFNIISDVVKNHTSWHGSERKSSKNGRYDIESLHLHVINNKIDALATQLSKANLKLINNITNLMFLHLPLKSQILRQ